MNSGREHNLGGTLANFYLRSTTLASVKVHFFPWLGISISTFSLSLVSASFACRVKWLLGVSKRFKVARGRFEKWKF